MLTDRTGQTPVGVCDFDLSMVAPPGVPDPNSVTPFGSRRWLFQVPVRLCAIEGSDQAQGKKAGENAGGRLLLDLLERVNKEIWFPQAQIAFSSAIETGIPVIADPSPDGSGQRGDIEVAFLSLEPVLARNACEEAWAAKLPGRVGIPVVNARAFVNSGLTFGVSPGPAAALFVASRKAGTGRRGDDLCGFPVRVTPADLVNQNQRPFTVMVDAKLSNAPTVLAHELGHNLFLGHGNGLDDNRDGGRIGRPGPRRYDEHCDPQWTLPPDNIQIAEGQATPLVDCATSGSLMLISASGGCNVLRPLQAETARGVALKLPGAVDGTRRDPGQVFTDSKKSTPKSLAPLRP